MFCNQCGEDNRDDRDFCIRCGKPLREGTEKTPKQIKQEEKEKYDHIFCDTKTYHIINVILWSIVSVSAILTLVSYFLKGSAKFAVIIIAFILLLGCFGLIITKRTMRKKTKEKVKLSEQTDSQSATEEKQDYEQIKIDNIDEPSEEDKDSLDKNLENKNENHQ